MRIILGTWGRTVSAPASDSIYLDLRSQTVQRGTIRVSLSPRVMRVATMLFAAKWRVSTKELVEAIYQDQTDGGPLDARGAAVQFILRFRRALACLGVTLDTGYGAVGYGVEIAADWAPPHHVVQFQPKDRDLTMMGGSLAIAVA